jgi:hypothetical protein
MNKHTDPVYAAPLEANRLWQDFFANLAPPVTEAAATDEREQCPHCWDGQVLLGSGFDRHGTHWECRIECRDCNGTGFAQ